MRQDEEAFILDRAHAGLGDWFGLHHAVDAGDRIFMAGGHRGAHRLRAKDGNLDPMFTIGDGEPFGETHGRVLGDRIRRRADLRQQPGGGRGVEQIATAARDHPRHQVARREDMRHQVDVPDPLPLIVGDLGSARDRYSGVGAEQVDRAVVALDPVDETFDFGLDADIDRGGDAADFFCGRGGAVAVEVGADHELGALLMEPARQCAPDSAGRAGHHDAAVFYVHGRYPKWSIEASL